MRSRPHVDAARLVAMAALAAAALWGVARADGISATLQPGYVNVQTDVTDQAGRTTHTTQDQLLQNYQLTLDKDLFRNVVFTAGGLFQDTTSWNTVDSTHLRTDDRNTGLFARLTLGTPMLGAGAGIDHREHSGTALSAALISDIASAYTTWRPLDLPELDLRFSRTHNYDIRHAQQDATITSALLGARQTIRKVDLRYTFNWTDALDDVNHVESRAVDQLGQASYGDDFFNKRTRVYASASIEGRTTSTAVSGPGGTVATQRLPVAGLSFVEAFPALPETDTLVTNALLIDGNTSASAGLDIGFGPTLAGDTNLRDSGAQFPDVVTQLNTIYVYVDKALPPEIVNAFAPTWEVFVSDDNLRWTPVPTIAPVVFGAFQNRFELTIDRTAARYVKVVTRPLPVGVTTDRTFADIFVTEIQFYLVVPASEVPRRQSSYNASVNATARTALLRKPDLDYDLTVNLNRLSPPTLTTYSLVNGLSYAQKLGRGFALTSRVARQDQDAGRGHEGIWQWSAAVVGNPLPLLYGALSYSGQYNDQTGLSSQSLNLFSRGDLYQGISAQGNFGGSISTLEGGRTATSGTASASASVVPNRYFTLSGRWLYNATVTTGGAQPESTVKFERIGATVSVTPVVALSGSAGVDRIILGPRPTTLATVQLSYSPLRGDLQLGFAYSKTLDTSAETTTEIITPSLRWNIRRGIFLDASYSFLDTSAPVQKLTSRVLSTSLLITL